MWEQVVLKRGPHISKVKSELSVQLRPSQNISLSLLSVNDNKVETVRLAMVISIKRHNSLILSIRSWWNLLFAPFFVRSPPSSSPYSSCKADRSSQKPYSQACNQERRSLPVQPVWGNFQFQSGSSEVFQTHIV